MKAISTKVLGPTDTKGLRVKAYDLDNNSVTITWDHSREVITFSNHLLAAQALIEKMGWEFEPYGGATKEGYSFVDITNLMATK